MIRHLLTIALLLMPALSGIAQQVTPPVQSRSHYGLFLGLDINQHFADFRALPGVPSCCPQYESGSGVGGTFGLLWEYPFSPTLFGAMRAGFFSAVGTLSSTEGTTVIVAGQDVPGEFEHTIDASLSYYGVQPMLGIALSESWRAYAGGRLSFVSAYGFEQAETIVKPEETGTFNNGRRTRNDTAGTIDAINESQIAIVAGLGLLLPLNGDATFLLSPEIFYALAVTPVVRQYSWNVGMLQLGVSLRYAPKPELPPQPVAVEVPPATQPEEHGSNLLAATIAALGVDADGTTRENVTLRVEEFISTHMRPLLNYLFFDENSAELPVRYTRLDPAVAVDFRIAGLHDVATLPTYHQVLNIVGRRMREHPMATITLVGCNADQGVEKGNLELSLRRAEAVRDYLASGWGIAFERVKIEARNLPEKPTNPAEGDGAAENRRVEIRSNAWEILEPVITDDTLRTATPPTIRFTTSVQSDIAVARWTVTATQNGRQLKQLAGEGEVPATIDWRVDAEPASMPRAPDPIVYELRLTDASGAEHVAPLGSLPVDQMTLRRKRVERIADREIDRYSLILFDFDRADLNDANRRIAEFIRGRITPSATVKITGHTDRIGEAEYNLKLSQDRARNVAAVLGVPAENARGEGEASPPYDNELPEGRCYSRTVSVVVETPVVSP